jgi:ferric-dicitrate binding protein FerR (iron transport regulator)
VLPGVNAAPAKAPPADGIARASLPGREPASVSRGGSKKLLTILAVGAAAGLAGVLAAKGHGGAQTAASAPGATPTTVGIGQITVGGPH